MTLQFGASLTVIIDDASLGQRPSLGSSITIVSSFIIQANVITIINNDRKTFIVQATELKGQLENWQISLCLHRPCVIIKMFG